MGRIHFERDGYLALNEVQDQALKELFVPGLAVASQAESIKTLVLRAYMEF